IPQVSLLELVRIDREEAASLVEHVHEAPVYRLREKLLPLVRLGDVLGTKPRAGAPEPDAVNVVVLQADDRQFGLVVDEVDDTEEIVVKPLGKQLERLSAFAGATIMGDGGVALILDVIGIARAANVLAEGRNRARVESADAGVPAAESRHPLLLFSA